LKDLIRGHDFSPLRERYLDFGWSCYNIADSLSGDFALVSKAKLLSGLVILLICNYLVDGKQRLAEITHFFEQPVQGSLVDDRAAEDSVTIFCQDDGHAFKPTCPA
jgi:hypothetical protein